MGKPFKSELEKIKDTIHWAEQQDVSSLSKFLFEDDKRTSLVCIGSGGSLSACHYAAQLYQKYNGVLAEAMTPLQFLYAGREIIRSNKLLFLSASGKNKDILNAIKYGVKYNETGMMSLTLRKNNPTEEFLQQYPKVQCWSQNIPTEKDGFLATNSLVATFTLLCKAAERDNLQVLRFKFQFQKPQTWNLNLKVLQNFIVLYGATGEPVAWDIESKLTEAALGATLLSDYRNFGHGRHHWFAKRKENSVIIALISPVEKDLAIKTIKNLPADVPIICIETELKTSAATIDMLLQAFSFVRVLGETRGIDPGRPGVPAYGRLLYNLDYCNLINRILPNVKTLDVAVRRKLGVTPEENILLWDYYRNACKRFVHRLNRGKYTTVAFDYDGTLSAKDYTSRFSNRLCDKIKVALQRLLESGIEICVATGRGKSVGSSFKNSFDKQYWSQIKVGYYNGACIVTLGEEKKLEEWIKKPFDMELKRLKEELKRRLPETCVKYQFEERNKQFSIGGNMTLEESQMVYEICHEIIWDRQLKGIHVWRSNHSMDVVVYNEVSKLSVINHPKTTLCIGDYGSMEGNDYELLTSPASLSVDKVSKNADTCWNIAPSGVTGLDATIYYLSNLNVTDGVIKCRFSI